MSNTPTPQTQAELLQHIAAIHEHRPGHRRDLSIEAMTKDLDGITTSPNAVADAREGFHDTAARTNKTSSASKVQPECIPRGDAALASSSVAGVAGSQQGC